MPQAKPNSISPAQGRLPGPKVALVQVARRQLGLPDEDFRSVLGVYGGVTSTTDLDQRGFTAVMARFEALGFRSTSRRKPLPSRSGMASPGQVSLMRQLWAECTGSEGTEAGLGKWLERQFGISSIRFVSIELAPKVIGGLTSMKAKLQAKASAGATA